MSPSDQNQTRRQMLRSSAGAVLGAGALSIAGCLETLPPLGQVVRYGRVDTPSPNDPVYRSWLPADSALPNDFEPGVVQFATPGDLGSDVIGIPNRNPHFFQKPHLDYFGIGYDNYDWIAGLHSSLYFPTFVLKGDIDTSVVDTTLRDSGYRSGGEYHGFDLYSRPRNTRTIAVSADAIVFNRNAESREVIESVIDAKRGTQQRHFEDNDTFAFATEQIGSNPWTWIGAPAASYGDPDVVSMSFTYDADAIYYINQFIYPANTTVTEQQIQGALEDSSLALESYAVEITTDGRLATVEMRQPHENLQADSDEGDWHWPQITWGLDNHGETVTLRHEGGESAQAADLTIYAEGADGRTETDTQFSDITDVVKPGDEVTVDLPPDTETERFVGNYEPVKSHSIYFTLAELL